jgi:hypothetical protein
VWKRNLSIFILVVICISNELEQRDEARQQNNETPSFSVPFVDFALGVAALGDEVEEGLELALGDDVEPGDEAGDEEGDDKGDDEGDDEGMTRGQQTVLLGAMEGILE